MIWKFVNVYMIHKDQMLVIITKLKKNVVVNGVGKVKVNAITTELLF